VHTSLKNESYCLAASIYPKLLKELLPESPIFSSSKTESMQKLDESMQETFSVEEPIWFPVVGPKQDNLQALISTLCRTSSRIQTQTVVGVDRQTESEGRKAGKRFHFFMPELCCRYSALFVLGIWLLISLTRARNKCSALNPFKYFSCLLLKILKGTTWNGLT